MLYDKNSSIYYDIARQASNPHRKFTLGSWSTRPQLESQELAIIIQKSSMSSGFVSSGTLDQPIERDDDWLQAQKEIEANRRRKEEGRQDGGKSLYEVLQQNKGEHTLLESATPLSTSLVNY